MIIEMLGIIILSQGLTLPDVSSVSFDVAPGVVIRGSVVVAFDSVAVKTGAVVVTLAGGDVVVRTRFVIYACESEVT